MTDLEQIRAEIVKAQLSLDDAMQLLDAITATEETPPLQDPRADNCRGHHLTDGKVDGIYLAIHYFEDARIRLKEVELIDEVAAQGQHVARCWLQDRNGNYKRCRFVLAWPYNGNVEHFDGHAGVNYDGGEKPAEIVITAKFVPPNLGPLVIYVAGADDSQINSDVVASIGLPFGHHIGLKVIFEYRNV